MPKSRIAAAQIDLHWVVHPVDQKRSVLNALDGSRQSAGSFRPIWYFHRLPCIAGSRTSAAWLQMMSPKFFEYRFARWFAFSYQLSAGTHVPLRANDLARGLTRAMRRNLASF